MFAFSVRADVALVTRHGYRRLRAAHPQDAAGGLDPGSIILAIHDEEERVRDALARQGGGTDAPSGIRFYRESELAGWPSWPMRLGRLASRADGTLAPVEAPSPLPAQLAALRARHPGRRRFRIALVGAFGYNLGDTLIGATAWRLLLPVLRAALRDVGADALFGPSAAPAVAELIGHEDGIDAVSFFGPSLLDFARYDAFFDLTGLVGLPRFHDMPALDWLLWWLGLDPDAYPATAKRNRLRLPEEAARWARARLAERPGRKIAFVWRASTPLRSMPDAQAVRFAEALLAAAPEITLVVDRPLALEHPRLLDLGTVTDSPERMMALVAQADGLIAVDSLAPHVADAADVPTVMLLATLPPARFPYYPRMRIVTPPGMEALPGFGVTKVAEAAWLGMRDDYAAAWTSVSAQACWSRLAEAADDASPRAARVTLGPARDAARTALPPAGRPFPHDAAPPHAAWIAAEMARFALQVLGPGRHAVLAGGGDGSLALALARGVAPGGRLQVLEPRRLRAQKLAAEAQDAGLAVLHVLPVSAGAEARQRTIPDFDPLGEADPNAWGNLLRTVPVATVALDALNIEECHALVLAAPQPLAEALSGALDLLRRDRPLLVAGPVARVEFDALRTLLDKAAYRGFLAWPDRERIDAALLLATPARADTRFEGFDPL